MSRDMKIINFGMSMKEQNMKFTSTKVVLSEMMSKVLRANNMSWLRVKHVSPLHMSKKDLPLKCHHCGKLDIQYLIFTNYMDILSLIVHQS